MTHRRRFMEPNLDNLLASRVYGPDSARARHPAAPTHNRHVGEFVEIEPLNVFFIVESHNSTSSGTTERLARHFVPELGARRTAGLLRALARDDCPDGSEKADIVERLVEMRRKASRFCPSMIGAARETGYPVSCNRIIQKYDVGPRCPC